MNKKVMALAVAGALAAPAAALAQVEIGGSLTVFYYMHDAGNDSASQSTDIMEASEPELYFRGTEKLGGGNSVWFQCAQDLGGLISGNTASLGTGWCNRNSAVGFRGGFGNVFLGNWDTPHKLIYGSARGWFGGTNSFTGGSGRLLLGGSASGAINTETTASFHRRQAQSLNYHSPNWGGFTINAALSAGNEGTGIPESSPLSPRLWSLGARFGTGPFFVSLGYEKHDDYNVTGAAVGTGAAQYGGDDDTNWMLVAGIRFGGFNMRAMYSNTEYKVTNSTNAEVTGWGLFADWNIQGPHTLRAQYATVDDIEGSSTVSIGVYQPAMVGGVANTGTGGDLMSIFYSYALSKRTELSAGYTSMGNDSNARYSLGKVTASAGQDQTSIGLVLKHRF